MSLTLSDVWAEARLAECTPTSVVRDQFQFLCPSCTYPVKVSAVDGDVEIKCEGGCNSSRIADELHSRTARVTEQHSTTWGPLNLETILAGVGGDEPPCYLARTDGVHLLYPGRTHSLSAEPEAGKGWMSIAASSERLAAGDRVIYIDFEDTPTAIVARLRAVGVGDDAIRDRFSYVRPEEPRATGQQDFEAMLALAPALVVLDGFTEALALEGLDLNSNSDIAEWLELPRQAARAGAAVIIVDHVVKDREARGRYAIGAQHKLAGVDVAYTLEVIEPFGRGREGLVKVSVKKDRPGHVRQHAEEDRIALMRLVSLDNGRVTVAFEPPAERGQGSEAFRPTGIMEKISRALEQEQGLSMNAVRAAVGGKTKWIDLALELLISEGHVTVARDGQAKRHHVAEPFREDTATHRDPTATRSRSSDTATPRPSLSRGVAGAGRGEQNHGKTATPNPATADEEAEIHYFAQRHGDAA